MAHWQKLAFRWLADPEAQIFVLQIHLRQKLNDISEVAFQEAHWYHHNTGVESGMRADGIRPEGAQVASELPVESLEHPNGSFPVSVDHKEADHLLEEEVVGVFQKHWETWEKLDLVLVAVVVAAGCQ